MMNKYILPLLLLPSLAWPTSCQLLINQPAYIKENLGVMNLSATGSNDIWLHAGQGDKRAVFNTNDLYEVTDSVGSRYFRLNGIAYNHTGTSQTYIYDLAYGFGVKPPAGNYVVKSYKTERKPVFGRTLDTIGDSITWWQHGRFMRCKMRDYGLMYDFGGTQTDVFGFGHDGKGGNKTTDVLDRIASIPKQDAYFILIGTNDRIEPQETVDNIKLIAELVQAKNTCAKVYISTLLPRNDAFNARNQTINALLRADTALCANCTLVDLGAYFNALPNWPTYLADGLHPNAQGYDAIAARLALIIK